MSVREQTHRRAAPTEAAAAAARPLEPQSRRLVDRFSVLVVAFAALLWASDVFFRGGLVDRGLSSSQIVFGEDLLISVFFLPVAARVVREARALSRRSMLAVLLIAVGPQALATVLFTESFSISFQDKAANETYLLQQLQPLIAMTLAWVVLGERRRPLFWPLAALALAGVYMVVFAQDPLQPLSDVQHGRITAALLAVAAAGLWACGTVLGRYVLRDLPFVSTTALRFWLAAPVLLVILLVRDRGGAFGHYGVAELPDLLGIALVPGFIALLLYYRALRSTPASMATLAETAYPVAVTLLLALPAPYGFSQAITVTQVAGSALLVGVMVALNLGKDRDVVILPPGDTPQATAA